MQYHPNFTPYQHGIRKNVCIMAVMHYDLMHYEIMYCILNEQIMPRAKIELCNFIIFSFGNKVLITQRELICQAIHATVLATFFHIHHLWQRKVIVES